MARCKLTTMNLRNIRKTKEYQALLIDFVSAGVVGKSVAEGLLGYTIPTGLLAADYTEPEDDDDEEQGSGGDTGSTGSTVTLLYFDEAANDGAGEWETETFTLADDTTEADIIAAAKTAFEDNTINTIAFIEPNDTYVEGTSEIYAKYKDLDPQPEAFANGQLIECFKTPEAVDTGSDTGITVTLLYFAGEWKTEELVLATNVPADERAGIIAAAKTAFTDDTINEIIIVEQNPEYVEGTSELATKYNPIDPQPTELTEGALILCYYEIVS